MGRTDICFLHAQSEGEGDVRSNSFEHGRISVFCDAVAGCGLEDKFAFAQVVKVATRHASSYVPSIPRNGSAYLPKLRK